MLRLDKVIKPWKESAALNVHINLYGFWNETAFLTKSGDVGMILSVPGVDYESLDRSEQEYAVKRLEAALKAFGPGFHVYQYLFKSNRPDIPFAKYDDPIVEAAIEQRRKFFEAKRDHLYQVEIFYCILLEGARSKTGVGTALARLLRDPEGAIAELKSQFTNDSMKKLLRTHIERDLQRLDQHVQAFARQLADFMQIEVLNRQGQFTFFRRLLNYDDWRVAGKPQSTQFLDYQVVNSDIEAERDHLRVTALVGGDERVREAHRESVRVALDQLEHYTQARIGGNHPPETTGKFIAAKFEHDTARPVDGYVAPQLHTHAVVFNVTERDNGQPRAIQPQSLFASQQFATAIYQSELTYRLRQFGYEITTGRSGAPEIKGYTQEYLDASSPRSQQIREYLERTGRSGKEAAEIAAHSTRDRKEIHSPGEVMAAHRKLAADFGHQADAVVRAARERSQHQEKPVNVFDRVRESLTFARDKNFEREAVVDERALIRDGLRRGMGEITHGQVRHNLEARLASGEFQIVERTQGVPGRQYTTAKTIEAEHEIISTMREGQNLAKPVLSRPHAIALADHHSHLNHAQKSVIEDVLSSPDRIQGIQGFAGSGKTTTLTVIRNAAESRGYQVEGFAPTSRAARQLNDAGIESGTLQGFLARAANPNLREQRHFYLVDESSLASTNQMREFLSRLGPHDRVLLIGDIRQHQGVEAGRPFEQLQEAGMRTATLDDIVRQKDPALKSAVELLATGQVSAALDVLQQQGRVKEIPNQEERVRAIAKSYVESPQNTLIVSPDNASRHELNLAVRQELKATGAVAPEDRNFRVLVQRQDMTGAERSWASHYGIDDVVRYTRGSKAIGIEAAAYASVVAINPSANELTVKKASGELATYDPRRLTGVSVYQEIQREFSLGERIQFTARDKSLGVANRDMAAIEAIHVDGRISVRLDNNRPIKFNPNEHRHLDHGYAVTSHSSQGLTAERVLVHGDTSVHPDLLNSRFAYVSISRASHEATLFTDDMAKLAPKLGADVSKTSALELNQTSSVGRGIGLAP